MLASVYIKDGNIHFYNENNSLTNTGGIAYELGRPLLDFVCYEPERFDDGFPITASAYDHDYAYLSVKEPEYIAGIKEMMGEFQRHEVYVFFYHQMLTDFIFTFVDSPRKAVERLAENLPGVEEKLAWTMDFEWPVSSSPFIRVEYADKERRLYRAAMDAVALMSEHLPNFQQFIIHEIEVLLHYRGEIKVPESRSIDYIDILDEYHDIQGYGKYYLEKPFRTFYGRVDTGQVEQLYGIGGIEELFRFEFVKMIEHDIFIKKCKNCERFFIPKRRVDAEYCERTYGDSQRKCSEIGATLRYEKKVAENPILEAYSKAYKRFNSRTRAKKMTQTEFLNWSEEARKLRDECMAGELPFEEFTAWLEQGRIRKSRSTQQ
jgi:hypothetical protein